MIELFTAEEVDTIRAAMEASRETDRCDLCYRHAIVLRALGEHWLCLSCAPLEARRAD